MGDGLIVCADDFGLDVAVNAAVEQAHTEGVLTAASLMVGAPAAADAVARAQRLPGLRVGLHLVLADGWPTLAPSDVPELVDETGHFGLDMTRAGVRFFFLPSVRRALAREVRAQFAAFAASGLPLDHVNAHKHFHLHPTVLGLILGIGREYGLRAVRLPADPGLPTFLWPWLTLMRRRLRAAGVVCNDTLHGLSGSGAMDEAALLAVAARLGRGVSEIYLHPAVRDGITTTMPAYRHRDELAALLSPRVRRALDRTGLRRGGYTDFTPGPS